VHHLHALVLASRRQLRRHLAAEEAAADDDDALHAPLRHQRLNPVKVLDLAEVGHVTSERVWHVRHLALAAAGGEEALAEGDHRAVRELDGLVLGVHAHCECCLADFDVLG